MDSHSVKTSERGGPVGTMGPEDQDSPFGADQREEAPNVDGHRGPMAWAYVHPANEHGR